MRNPSLKPEEDETQPYSPKNTLTRTIEQKRAFLRHAQRQHPQDARIAQALAETLSPALIARAALRGVFIAYARADEVSALEIHSSLREANVTLWLDALDIPDDADWSRSVAGALHICGVMLALFSPAALNDNDFQRHLLTYHQHGKIIIPILLKEVDASHLPIGVNAIDMRHDLSAQIPKLISLFKAEAG